MQKEKITQMDFYYWGDQCPYNHIILSLLREIQGEPAYQIRLHDISERPEIAASVQMYSPTLLIFDQTVRWNGPIQLETIQMIHSGTVPGRKPYAVSPGAMLKGEIRFLSEETVPDMAQPCGCSALSCCRPKAEWVRSLKERYGLPHLGVLHYQDGVCVGGAEFTPSLAVPYPIPRDERSAFLTCSFLSDEVFDYRSWPLRVLEEELSALGYQELLAVVSENVAFPNGPLDWFLARGYVDQGELYFEVRDHARMHLVKKQLKPV